MAMVIAACNSANQNGQEETAEEQVDKSEVVNVYTHRYYDADKELFALFEKETGIKVNVKSDKSDKLIQLLQSEGAHTEADLLLTVDAGRQYYAKQLGLLGAVNSEVLNTNIPAHLRDPENYWFGLTIRARVIMYNKETVDPAELSTYEDLTSEKWKGQIMVRSAGNIYNQSLMASVVHHHGEEGAMAWAEGVVANMAREPKGNDRDQIKQVAVGNGKLAIVNTYYLGKLKNSDNDLEREAAEKVAVFFPNQETTGTHINVSGAALTKHAPNKENAIKLLEFMSGETAQSIFAESNYEYPANPAVPPSALLQDWGEFKADQLNLSELGALNEKAVELFEAAGWK